VILAHISAAPADKQISDNTIGFTRAAGSLKQTKRQIQNQPPPAEVVTKSAEKLLKTLKKQKRSLNEIYDVQGSPTCVSECFAKRELSFDDC
jgi:hypothetical protein